MYVSAFSLTSEQSRWLNPSRIPARVPYIHGEKDGADGGRGEGGKRGREGRGREGKGEGREGGGRGGGEVGGEGVRGTEKGEGERGEKGGKCTCSMKFYILEMYYTIVSADSQFTQVVIR